MSLQAWEHKARVMCLFDLRFGRVENKLEGAGQSQTREAMGNGAESYSRTAPLSSFIVYYSLSPFKANIFSLSAHLPYT